VACSKAQAGNRAQCHCRAQQSITGVRCTQPTLHLSASACASPHSVGLGVSCCGCSCCCCGSSVVLLAAWSAASCCSASSSLLSACRTQIACGMQWSTENACIMRPDTPLVALSVQPDCLPASFSRLSACRTQGPWPPGMQWPSENA
jgi:hypothetical protein